MGHDQRFKEFLQLFLRGFLKLFCPEVEERLDFETLELIDRNSALCPRQRRRAYKLWNPLMSSTVTSSAP